MYNSRLWKREAIWGKIASCSHVWNRYWRHAVNLVAILSPVLVPQATRDATRPKLLLVFKVANVHLADHNAELISVDDMVNAGFCSIKQPRVLLLPTAMDAITPL